MKARFFAPKATTSHGLDLRTTSVGLLELSIIPWKHFCELGTVTPVLRGSSIVCLGNRFIRPIKSAYKVNLHIQGASSGYVLSKTHTIQPLFKGNLETRGKCPLNRGVPPTEVTNTNIMWAYFGSKFCVPWSWMEVSQRRVSTFVVSWKRHFLTFLQVSALFPLEKSLNQWSEEAVYTKAHRYFLISCCFCMSCKTHW